MITICQIWYRKRLDMAGPWPSWPSWLLNSKWMHELSKLTLIQLVSFWFPDPYSLHLFATYVPKESKGVFLEVTPQTRIVKSCRFVARKEVERMTWQWLCWIFNERHLLWSSLCRLLTSLLHCLLLDGKAHIQVFRERWSPKVLRCCRLCSGSKHRKEMKRIEGWYQVPLASLRSTITHF